MSGYLGKKLVLEELTDELVRGGRRNAVRILDPTKGEIERAGNLGVAAESFADRIIHL